MALCLIVDDDRDSREGYAEFLRAAGVDVTEAADGDAAVKSVDDHPPDIMLVDLQMPAIDGWQLIRGLRARPSFGDTPIIVVSACVFPDDQERAAEAGCDAFLEKPCLPDRVLTEVLTRLERSRALRHG